MIQTKTIAVVALAIAALGAVGITTAVMSSITPAHAQNGHGLECHSNGVVGSKTWNAGCTGGLMGQYGGGYIYNGGTGYHSTGP